MNTDHSEIHVPYGTDNRADENFENDERKSDYCNHVFENHRHLRSNKNENCSQDWREHLKHVKDLLLKPEVINPRKKRESRQVPRSQANTTQKKFPYDSKFSDLSRTQTNHFDYNKKKLDESNFTQREIECARHHQKSHLMELSSQHVAEASEETLKLASDETEILQDFHGQPQVSNNGNGRARHRRKKKIISSEGKELGRETSRNLSGHTDENYRRQKTVMTGTKGGFGHVSESVGEFRAREKHSSPPSDDQIQKTTCSEPTSKDYERTKSKKPRRRKHKKVSSDEKETGQGMFQTQSGLDDDLKSQTTVITGGREGFVPISDSGREFRSTDKPNFHSTDDQSPSPAPAMAKSATKNSERTESKNSSKRKIVNLKRSKFDQEKISGDRTKLLQQDESLRMSIPLYVKIHALLEGIGKVEEVLNKKLNPEVKLSVRPDETEVKKFNSCTYCTIYSQNKSFARKLEELLSKDKDKFTPQIDCSFVEYKEISCRQIRLETERNLLIAQTRCEFNAKADEVLDKHNQNMAAMKESLKSAKKKLSEDVSCKQKESEVAVLEERVIEMERQKAEFMNSRTTFRKNLESLYEGDTSEKERRDLLKQYGVECCRLAKPLPMYARRRDIVDLVTKSQVSVILGETGSGKSTQMVQYLLEAGFAKTGFIASTQPRKIAAISLAIRVAEELASQTGKEVGYKVGSKSRHSSNTKIVFMTDLTLLNECLKDPDFSQYSCILVDEAHERSLYTDILLTMIKRCLPRRPDLRVVITSATIDPEVFVAFFGNCPVLTVSGRTYPVEIIWQDDVVEEYAFDNYVEEAAKKAVEIHLGKEPGDILVFLTSMVETEKCCKSFQQKVGQRRDYKCFQLHGKLPPDEQRVVFQPLGKDQRKIIFATNFAETSITIDGIRFVVDTGVAKEMYFDPKKNMNCLVVNPVSKSSAEQRKGRAGRTAPGKCYRLYSKRSFRAMKPASLPEILRTNVGQAILKLADFGIGPDMYDFVESPSEDAITQAQTSLVRLGALAKDGTITEEGKWIARLPFDPKLGLLTSLGKNSNLLFDAVVLSAVMNADGNVFYRGTTAEKQAKHDKAKVKFSESGGDCLTAFNVLKKWWSIPKNQKNKWCMDNSLNSKVLKGISETVAEILHTLKKEVNIEVKQKFSDSENAEDLLRRMIFKCYSSNLCHYLGLERAGYFAAELSRQVHVHPSSCMNVLAMSPEWVVYNQVLKTSRDFITGVTTVEESWLNANDHNLSFEVEDIRKKKVTNIFTQAAGSHAFFSLIGPHYCKLGEYEEMASSESSSVVVVEASRETGEVKVYSTEGDVCTLVNRLKETVEKSVQELVDEDMELPVGKETSGLRVILGRGGEVKDVLMPEESRKVFISQASDTTSEDSLRAKFSKAGEIKFCKQFDKGRNWGMLIFRTREEAKMAEEMSKNDKCDVARVEWRQSVKYQADLKARLTWCRRPLRGSGFIHVSPAYVADVCRLKSFYVENDLVKIRLDKKNGDSFYISDLKHSATRELVEGSLLDALGLPPDKEGIVEKTVLLRENVGKTSERERSGLQAEIKNAFQNCLKFSAVEIKVKPPNEKDSFFYAEAFFTDPIEGVSACRSLGRHYVLNGSRVDIVPDISGSLIVQQRIVDVCGSEIDKVVDMLSTDEIKVKRIPLGSGNMVRVTVTAFDVEGVVRARTCLNQVFKGDVLQCSATPVLMHLLAPAGRAFLKRAEKEIEAFVSVDNRLRTISVHGSESACTRMRTKMNEYIEQLLSGTAAEVCLKGVGKPPGLLKTLVMRHGEDAEGFRIAAGLRSVVLDYRRHLVKMIGSAESVGTAQTMIDELTEEVREKMQLPKPEESYLECVACFCPIEKGDLYRLEYCAHPYCRDCIKRQVNVAIADHSFPVLCSQEGCEQPLVWRDFKSLVHRGAFSFSALTSAALSSFTLIQRDAVRFCTTPDCPMVYRVSPEEGAVVFQCPECSVRLCSACHSQAHDGETCAMLRSAKNQDKDIEKWVRLDPNRRKACPTCKMPIEKIEGCNKMVCQACKTIFCWLCRKVYPSSETCYAHLKRRHGGIWNNEADLLYNDN